MFNLPNEVKLDLLKCLNFDQLFNFRLINFYFNDFINKNEGILARKEFYSIKAGSLLGKRYWPKGSKLIEHNLIEFGFCLDYKLNDQLIEKWRSSLNQRKHISRPSFKNKFVITLLQRVNERKFRNIFLEFCPRNVEEMKIARYFLEQLFLCYFHEIDFEYYLISSKMINLLFDDDKTTKLKFSGHKAKLHYYEQINVLDFAVNHLLVDELNIDFHEYKNPNQNENKSLLNLLMNQGARFKKINCRFSSTRGLFYSLINKIEASTNYLNIVAKIEIVATESFDIKLCARAKNKNKEGGISTFEVNNINNPKVKFFIKLWEHAERIVYRLQIRRILWN
ncbi:hypothetical protein ACQ4LE_009899 [Meloidogyne hapla]|uniref:F-box domain-containing protein n=2 Tax=Meloidogyne hapla TaxID=6305 RepID=A0A1I8C2N1_MELHA